MDEETRQDFSQPAENAVAGVEGEAASHPAQSSPVEPGSAGVTESPTMEPQTPRDAWLEFDPMVEDRYWAETYNAHPYAYDLDYKAFQPACRYGWESFLRYPGRSFDEVEPELRASWDQYRGESDTEWERARAAARAAWNRLGRMAAPNRMRASPIGREP